MSLAEIIDRQHSRNHDRNIISASHKDRLFPTSVYKDRMLNEIQSTVRCEVIKDISEKIIQETCINYGLPLILIPQDDLKNIINTISKEYRNLITVNTHINSNCDPVEYHAELNEILKDGRLQRTIKYFCKDIKHDILAPYCLKNGILDENLIQSCLNFGIIKDAYYDSFKNLFEEILSDLERIDGKKIYTYNSKGGKFEIHKKMLGDFFANSCSYEDNLAWLKSCMHIQENEENKDFFNKLQSTYNLLKNPDGALRQLFDVNINIEIQKFISDYNKITKAFSNNEDLLKPLNSIIECAQLLQKASKGTIQGMSRWINDIYDSYAKSGKKRSMNSAILKTLGVSAEACYALIYVQKMLPDTIFYVNRSLHNFDQTSGEIHSAQIDLLELKFSNYNSSNAHVKERIIHEVKFSLHALSYIEKNYQLARLLSFTKCGHRLLLSYFDNNSLNDNKMYCDDIDDINTSNIIDSNIRAAYLNKVKAAIEKTRRMLKIPEKNIDINSIINAQKCESIRGTVEKIKSALFLLGILDED